MCLGRGDKKTCHAHKSLTTRRYPVDWPVFFFPPCACFFTPPNFQKIKVLVCACARVRARVCSCVSACFYLFLCVFVCALKSHRLRVQSTCVVPRIFDDIFCVEGSNADEG